MKKITRLKCLLLAGLLLISLPATYAQNCLGFTWQIKSGDSAQWQAAGFVPQNWGRINIGVNLERQGYACCSGYYSLWNQVVIPAAYKSTGDLQLRFKFDAKKAEVFFNGTAIGSTGQPGGENTVVIPPNLVRWDKLNQVFVKVFNPFYTGGSCNTYIHIVPAKQQKQVSLNAGFINEQHVYTDSSNIQFSVSTKNVDAPPFRGLQKIIILNQFNDTVFVTASTVSASPAKRSVLYRPRKLAPGFYQVQLSFSAPGIESQKIYAFAVAPESIQASTGNLQEVSEYWNNAIKELAAIDPQYKLTRVDSLSSDKNNVYLLEMRSLGNLSVRGWYIVPAKAGVYPAIAHFQGYSVAWRPRWFLNDTDVIHLAIDIRGHGLSADVINPGFGCPGYVGYNLDKPDDYIYRGAFMDAYRAVEFLLSRKEVDASRIAVDGHSQGGGIAVAMAALHAGKIKFCSTASPWLCDFPDHVRTRPIYWQEMQYYMQQKNMSSEQVYKMMGLVDIINLCQRIQCPVLMGTGLFDDDCPSYIDFAMFNHIKAKKEYRILPNDGHLLGNEWAIYSRKWARSMLGVQVEGKAENK